MVLRVVLVFHGAMRYRLVCAVLCTSGLFVCVESRYVLLGKLAVIVEFRHPPDIHGVFKIGE